MLVAVSPCNSISKVVKISAFHNNQEMFKIQSGDFAKSKHFVQFSLTGMHKLGSAGHPPYGHCEGRHSGDGGNLIRYVLVFVPLPAFPFVSPDLYCSCSQNINLSLIYFPLMSQRKYWGLPPGWIVAKSRKISHHPMFYSNPLIPL